MVSQGKTVEAAFKSRNLLWLAAATMVFSGAALQWIDQSLITPVTPWGIVSFEFCGLRADCRQALSHWGSSGRLMAMLSLGLDYLFLLAYPAFIALALLQLRQAMPTRARRITTIAIQLCPLIVLADAIENTALIQVVLDAGDTASALTTTPTAEWIAAGAATLKFGLLLITLGWLAAGTLIVWRQRQRKGAEAP